jgi:hypothetical protein
MTALLRSVSFMLNSSPGVRCTMREAAASVPLCTASSAVVAVPAAAAAAVAVVAGGAVEGLLGLSCPPCFHEICECNERYCICYQCHSVACAVQQFIDWSTTSLLKIVMLERHTLNHVCD